MFSEDKKSSRVHLESTINKGYKKRLTHVKSGLAFDQLPLDIPGSQVSIAASFVQSRAARVLLAGAGFLADAVSKIFILINHYANII